MNKLVFVISHLHDGGGARVLSVLANHFSGIDGFEVSVITHVKGTAYQLNECVTINSLYQTNEIRRSFVNRVIRRLNYFPRLIRAVRRQAPSNVVVLLRGMNWRLILVCRLLGIRVIATEHTNHLAERGLFSWIERRFVYKLANDLVVLTKFDGDYYRNYLNSVHVISNPLSFAPIIERRPRSRRILVAGDLNRWFIKGFDNIIQIFSAIHQDYPDWRLVIAGSGEEGERHLVKLATQYQVREYVDFLGFCNDLDLEMQNSEIFVLSSRYEGFSMVLLEAMSQGCACVSFNCPAGPGDLIVNGVSGMLVPDQDCVAMEHDIRLLIESEAVRNKLSMNAVRASEAYAVNEIAKTWMKLFSS